jgi:hypothetical protein
MLAETSHHTMANSLSRIFLAASAVLLLFGGAVHTLAFKKAVAAAAGSDLAPFFSKALKGLWLIDSTMLITLAIVFGLIAVRPVMASRVVVALLTLMPAVVAVLLYCFIGAIMPAHLLVVVAALGFASALLRPRNLTKG